MGNGLAIFEGVELEILTKEDVNIEFNGECLFCGKQVCEILLHSNPSKAIKDNVDEENKLLLKNSDITVGYFRKLNNAGEMFINEDGVLDLIYNSKLQKAKEFKKKVREIVKEVQATGKYDLVEQELMKIEDQEERELKIALYKIEDIVKSNPNDMLLMLTYNNKKQQLNTYIQNKKLKEIQEKVNDVNNLVSSIDNKIKKTTVLREGDMSAEAIAKKFNIFSVTNKPHNKFAENLARVLGFYLIPEGNIGYQDDYISINLTTRGGVTIPTIKYSSLAFSEMEKYISTDGLHFENPPVYYKRKCKGGNVGDFNYGRIIFDDIEESIKVNKTTYFLYNSKELEEF